MDKVKYLVAGDSALIVEFGQEINPRINGKVRAFVALLKEQYIEGVTDILPTFRSVMISYDPRFILFNDIKEQVQKLVKTTEIRKMEKKKIIEIPVCYGGVYGPDMAYVMEHTNLTQEEVITLHTNPEYLIYMLGFLPGFAYLGGLDQRLVTPRLATPRMKIDAGCVGIGGEQTGIYPLDSPGGWQIIGKTPIKPYDPNREEPFLYEAGHFIRFKPITESQYLEIKALVNKNAYHCNVILGGA